MVRINVADWLMIILVKLFRITRKKMEQNPNKLVIDIYTRVIS